MANGSATSDLRNTWETAAPGWAKWEHVFDAGFAEATDTLLDMAAISPGMRILDIGCGSGSQSLQAARRVGTSGTVIASDISATMLDYVRQNARSAGLENIETVAAPAEALDPALAPFDAAISRMALMLFPSPDAALTTVRGLLKPGARFAALVFTTAPNNPFLAQPMAILLRHAGKPMPAPGGPGLFALGGQGVLGRLLSENGFANVRTQIVQATITLPSAADALHLMQEAAGAYRAVVADLDEVARARAWDEVHDCLQDLASAGRFETRLEAIIGSGVNPE